MRAIYRMLKRREYTARDGSRKIAHNLEMTVPDVGTGDLYISADVYNSIKDLSLIDGDEVGLTFGLDVFRGEVSPRLVAVNGDAVSAGGVIAIYRMLKRREYTARDGSRKIAHNLEMTVPDVGTGDLYISADVYNSIRDLALIDGDEVGLTFGLDVFRGEASPRLVAVTPAVMAA